MWLTKNPNPSSTSQQIGLLNWVPQAEENDIELTGIKEGEGGQKMIYTNAHMIRNARFGLMKAQWGMIDWTFKGLRETIEKLNTRLKETPVPGTETSLLQQTTTMLSFWDLNIWSLNILIYIS